MSEFLKGRKTYIVATLIAFSVFAFHMGWITDEVREQVFMLLTGTGLATLRLAVTK